MRNKFRAKNQSIWEYYLSNSLKVVSNNADKVLKTDAYNENNNIPVEGGIALNIPGEVSVLEYDKEVASSVEEKYNGKIKVKQGDIRNLPYPDEYFDVLIDLSTIDHVPPASVPEVINNYSRVLKKNGTLLLFSWCSSFKKDLLEPDEWDFSAQYYFNKRKLVREIKKQFIIKEEECLYPAEQSKKIIDRISRIVNPGQYLIRIIANKR